MLRVELSVSPMLMLHSILLHLLALCALPASGIAAGLSGALVPALAISLFRQLQRISLRARDSVSAVTLSGGHAVRLETRAGVVDGELLTPLYCTSTVQVLRFYCNNPADPSGDRRYHRTVIITPDNCDAETRRRLRVRLLIPQ